MGKGLMQPKLILVRYIRSPKQSQKMMDMKSESQLNIELVMKKNQRWKVFSY